MNITDQIIEAANVDLKFQTSDISRRASNLIREDQIEYYKKEYQKIAQKVNESKFSASLPLSKLLLFNAYEEISNLCRSVFRPLSAHRDIIFNDIKTDSPRMGKLRTPEVHHHFDFSRDTAGGVELADYLTQLYILKWLKVQMGYDMQQYPNKYHLVVFKQDDTIYIWQNDSLTHNRLYIDENANEKILDAYYEILKLQKGGGILTPLLEGIPYKEGEEAQKIFDINWYKHTTQTPLTYRCFPNTFTLIVRPDPHPDLCKHSGEYCIDKNELDNRYSRFLNIYNHLNDAARFDLVKNTIELFEKFMLTGSFTKISHSEHYTYILEKLRAINKKVRLEVEGEVLKCLGHELESFIERNVIDQAEKDNLAVSARFDPLGVTDFKTTVQKSIYNELSGCDPVVAPYITSFINSVKVEKDYKKHRIDICTDFLNREFSAPVKDLGEQFYSVDAVESISDWNCMSYLEDRIMPTDRNKFNSFVHYIILASRLFKLDDLTQAVESQTTSSNDLPDNQSYSLNNLNHFYYQLNLVENKSHKTIQTLCQGFPIYLLWTNANNKNVATVFKKHPRYDTPEQKALFFNAYFNPLIEKARNATPTFDPFDEKLFTQNHIITEKENFQNLKTLENFELAIPINIIENWLVEYVNHLSNLYQLSFNTKINTERRSSNTNKKIQALKWTTEPQKLIDLFDAFVEAEIIVSNKETFKKAFSGELLVSPLEIKWNLFVERSGQPEIVGLFYFLDKIKSTYKIMSLKGKQDKSLFYDAICQSFVNAKGEVLDRNTIRNRSNFDTYNCDNSDKIDKAIINSKI